MKKPPHMELAVTKNLIMLERGADELLLANSADLNPLYVRGGGAYIKKYLTAVNDLVSTKKIHDAFPKDDELLAMLAGHRIVIPKGSPDRLAGPATALGKKKREPSRGAALYLLLSQSCNLGCIYCLNGTKSYDKEKNLRMEEPVAFRAVERVLADLAPKGALQIVFFGGEPLLNWPLAKKIITHCEQELKPKYPDKSIKYHLTSNLAHLPDDLIEWAKRHQIGFLCDVDGPPDLHNRLRPYRNGKPSHDDIAANIKRIVDAGLAVSLRSTLTSLNQDRMEAIARHHKEIGGYSSAFVPLNPVNSDEDIFPASLYPSPTTIIEGLAEVYHKKIWESRQIFPLSTYAEKVRPGAHVVVGCGAPYGNTPVVAANGDVYPCIYLVGIPRFFIGNITDDSYPDTGVLDGMMEFLSVDNNEECTSCSWRYLCGGGCPVGRLTVLDNPTATDEVRDYCKQISCNWTKKALELLLWERAQTAAARVDDGQKETAVLAEPICS
jgi:uncharacterized protein